MAFANGEDSEPSHQDLRCLTVRLSTLHINVFPIDSLLKKSKQSRRHISPSFGALGKLCFVTEAFPGYFGLDFAGHSWTNNK